MKALRLIRKLHRRRFITGLLLVGCATAAVFHSAAALAIGYATDDQELKPGMVTSLSDSGTPEEPKVERASLGSGNPIIGVAAALGSDLVTVVSASDQVYVQSTGEVGVFVSDLNGSIESGDVLALSPLRGILVKSGGDSTGPVIGVALEGLSESTAETREIETEEGVQEVLIGTVSINLDNSAFSGSRPNSGDSSIGQIGEALTGREVGEVRVISALIIFIIVLVAEGGIIYGAIVSSITALGRNPLAKKVILKEVIRVLAIAIAVLALGVLSIYAILWL